MSKEQKILQKQLNYIFDNYQNHKLPFGWEDFKGNSSGTSNTWVSSAILYYLGNLVPEFICENFLNQEYNFIKKDNGVGYSNKTPSDCDSTVFYLLAKFAFNCSSNSNVKQVDFINSHQSNDGGFRTFYSEDKIRKWKRNKLISYKGWCKSHPCVSATVLLLYSLYPKLRNRYNDNFNQLLDYTYNQQEKEGYTNSYWWYTKYYATVFNLLALNNLKLQESKYFKTGKEFILSTFKDRYWSNGFDNEPCIFSTILSLKFLLALRRNNPKIKSIIYSTQSYLIEQTFKNNKGLLNSQPLLKIPNPSIEMEHQKYSLNSKGIGTLSSDQNNLYTCSLYLSALNNKNKTFS